MAPLPPSRLAGAVLLALALQAVQAAPAPLADAVPPAQGAGQAPAGELSAAQIVEKNVAARGGLEAWRKIQNMVWVGHLQSPDSPDPVLPFFLEQERPNKTHFEIDSAGQKSMRVFDGTRGWKARPGKNPGAADVRPFSPQELKFARDAQGIDGPLIDYAAHGSTVALLGTDIVEGRKAYRIAVRAASGERHDVWIDAETFLDLRYDRTTYSAKGEPGVISILYRDYKTIEGLRIPGVMEIGVGSARVPDKMIIEKVALNAPLDPKTFTRPGGMKRRGPTFVDINPNPSGPVPMPGSNGGAAPPGAPAPR